MKARIHINRHKIRSNAKNGESVPVIPVKTYRSNESASNVRINGPSEVVYSPHRPLSCGAKVWIEADYDDLILK